MSECRQSFKLKKKKKKCELPSPHLPHTSYTSYTRVNYVDVFLQFVVHQVGHLLPRSESY
jgi:hypothetical protein